MNDFQGSNNVSENLEKSFSRWSDPGQKSTLWIGNREETPITAITTHETKTTLILKLYISDIHQLKLELQITPETVLVQGQPTDAIIVPGYFRPSGFANLIPLPQPVQPETCSAQIHVDGVIIQLAKLLKTQLPKVWIEVPPANSRPSSKMCI